MRQRRQTIDEPISVVTYRYLTAQVMREDELLAGTIRIARDLAYLVFHPHRSDHSESGFPDLTMVRANAVFGPPRFVVAELKREDDGTPKTALRPAQCVWRDVLTAAGIEWFLWRPSDLLDGTITTVLSGQGRAT